MLQLDQVAAVAAPGGRLAATGWVQLAPGPARLYVTGRLENVSLAAVPGVSARQNIRGRADARFAVSGTSRNVRAAATVYLSRLAYNQARLESAEARLDYEDGIIFVRALQAEDERGQLVAAGTVGRRGELDLQVRARGIDLAALLAPFTEQPVEGIAYFAGRLGGTVREPRLGGDLQLYAGRIGGISTDYAEGQLVIRPNEAVLESLELRLYPGQVIV